MNTNKKIEFGKLEVEQEEKGFKSWIKSKHVKRTIIAMLIGAGGGFIYFILTEGAEMKAVPTGDIVQDVIFGALIGLFVTNSPCAKNKC